MPIFGGSRGYVPFLRICLYAQLQNCFDLDIKGWFDIQAEQYNCFDMDNREWFHIQAGK